MRRKSPSSTIVVFVRHGSTPSTGKDMPEPGPGPSLSELGRRQAEEAAQYIAAWKATLPPLAAIYSSPLCRARETAAIVAKALEMEVVERPDLADCDAGEWAGQPLRQLARKAEWATVQQHPSGFQFPGGEAMAAMSGRLLSTVRDLVLAHEGRSVVAVSHSDPIKAVLSDALGLHLDLFQRILVSPASVSAVSYSPAGPTVLLTNWAGPSVHAQAPAGTGATGRSAT